MSNWWISSICSVISLLFCKFQVFKKLWKARKANFYKTFQTKKSTYIKPKVKPVSLRRKVAKKIRKGELGGNFARGTSDNAEGSASIAKKTPIYIILTIKNNFFRN